MKTTIKDASGKTVAQTMEAGDRTLLQDASGSTLGWHDKNTNQTYNKSGRAVYKGNHLSALLED